MRTTRAHDGGAAADAGTAAPGREHDREPGAAADAPRGQWTGGTRRRSGRTAGALAAAALLAAVGAACSSNTAANAVGAGAGSGTGGVSASPSGPGTATSTAAPATGPASPSSSATGGAGASGGSAGGACQDAAVRTTTLSAGAGMGHQGLILKFTNAGPAACTLHGYPGAELVGAGSRVIMDADRSLSGYLGGAQGYSSPPTVTLAPGASASALLEWDDVPVGTGAPVGANCPGMGSTELLVTPPNTRATTALAPVGSACQGFTVHPVVPGATGTAPAS